MKIFRILAILVVIAAAVFAATRILNYETPTGGDPHGHGHEAEAEKTARGPHGGRLFGDRDFQCEVTIYEPEGVTPAFRVYFYKDGKPMDPAPITLTITLERINR